MFYSNRMNVHSFLFNTASQLAIQDSERGGDFQHLESSDFQCLILCLLSFQHQAAKISRKVVFVVPLDCTGLQRSSRHITSKHSKHSKHSHQQSTTQTRPGLCQNGSSWIIDIALSVSGLLTSCVAYSVLFCVVCEWYRAPLSHHRASPLPPP